MTTAARRMMPQASTGFDPSSISGLKAWYKADGVLYQDSARTTLATADGDPVGSWTDAGANARNANQATSTKRPLYKTAILNGKPVLRFDGVDDHVFTSTFPATISQPDTVFVVCSENNAGSAHRIFDATGSNRQLIDLGSTPGHYAAYAGTFLTDTAVVTPTPVVLCATYNGASSKLWLGGGSTGSIPNASGNAGSAAIDNMVIGIEQGKNVQPFNGDIAEILLYDSNLSNANRDLVGGYLATKYGLTWAASS